MNIPELVKAARKKTGLTQTKFGNLLGFSQPTVLRWEKGKSEPGPSTIRELWKILEEERQLEGQAPSIESCEEQKTTYPTSPAGTMAYIGPERRRARDRVFEEDLRRIARAYDGADPESRKFLVTVAEFVVFRKLAGSEAKHG